MVVEAVEADVGDDEDVHPSLKQMIMLSLRCPDAVPLLRPLPLLPPLLPSPSSSSPEGTDFEVFD